LWPRELVKTTDLTQAGDVETERGAWWVALGAVRLPNVGGADQWARWWWAGGEGGRGACTPSWGTSSACDSERAPAFPDSLAVRL
jgi:hypothetical protein